MNVFAGVILGMFLAIFAVVVLFLSIALFVEAFSRPQTGGMHAVAGAILIGSSINALAIATNRGPDHYR